MAFALTPLDVAFTIIVIYFPPNDFHEKTPFYLVY